MPEHRRKIRENSPKLDPGFRVKPRRPGGPSRQNLKKNVFLLSFALFSTNATHSANSRLRAPNRYIHYEPLLKIDWNQAQSIFSGKSVFRTKIVLEVKCPGRTAARHTAPKRPRIIRVGPKTYWEKLEGLLQGTPLTINSPFFPLMLLDLP